MKLGLLLGAALAPLAFAGAAFAQTAPAPSAQLDEIVVTGSRPIAESEAAALQVQRNSDALVSVVSSDSVGRFPDQNIAFAVGRLPGVGIQRDQGQARYVNLRGAPINWTTLSFDGINVVSPEGRRSRFDNIPSALASQIIAQKAVTPDMPGETLAGNINIITRSPFDYPGFNADAKVGLGLVALGGGEEVDTSFVVSNVFADGTFGALVSASYYSRNMVTDNFETDWETVSQDSLPGAADRPLWANEHENKLYRLTRYNRSLSGRLEWRPNDATELFVTSIYSEYRDDELRSNIKIDLDDRQSSTPSTACSARPANGTTVSGGNSGYADVCTGNTPFQGTVFGVDFDNNFNDLESVESTWTTTLGGNHDDVAGWDFQWRLNYTEAEDGRDAPALTDYDSDATRTVRPTVVYDFRDPDLHRMELYRTIQNLDGTYSRGARVLGLEEFAIPLVRLRRRTGGANTEAYTARFDAEREFDFGGVPVEFKFGGEYAERTKRDEETQYDIGASDIIAAGLPRTFSAIAIDRPFLGDIVLGYDFRYHGSDLSRALVDQAIASGRGTTTNTFGYEVTEEALAAYAMGTFEFDWGNIVAGARVERTTNTGEAPSTVTPLVGPAVTVTSTSSSEDTLVFPSVHLNWDLADNKKVRFSINTGAARADYDQLRPGFTVNDALQTANGGNPSATPEKAVGADAYFEWYLAPRGIFQMGVFHKQIEDVLFTSVTSLGPVTFPDGLDRSDYVLTSLVNGFEGEITGFEIAYQQPAEALVEAMGLPEWMGGFGIQANATFTESEAQAPDGRTVRLPGTSDYVYNIIPYYEMYGLSVRLAYQVRSEWLDRVFLLGTGGVPNAVGGDQFWGKDEELDFSVRYSVNDNVEVYFDAVNLLDGPGVRYSTAEQYVIEYETFGERYNVGLRFNF